MDRPFELVCAGREGDSQGNTAYGGGGGGGQKEEGNQLQSQTAA